MSTALAPPAVPAGLTAGPPPAAAAPAAPVVTTPAVGAPASAAEAVVTPPVADPRAPIDALAVQFGYEPSQLAAFGDVESAKAAIRMAAESTATEGFKGPGVIAPVSPAPVAAAPPVYYQQPTPPSAATAPVRAPAIDLKALGLEDDEPAAKAFRVLEGRVSAAEQASAEAKAQWEAQQKAQIQQNREALRAQAGQVVDSFADPKYGTSKARTSAQAYNLSRLYDLADAILIGAVNRGQPSPPLQVRLNQARLIDEAPAIAAPGAAAPVPATLGALPNAAPPVLDPAPKMSMTDKWSANPQLMAQLR